ncbi:heme-binding protein [Paludisphaera mucosa]|uniref:Heme-binding protein n=1 Tax=Paludisphaera mucosa TaxID=3030827 RepID=A0ABT6FFQ4_9BACT|nr:heme-binding protein [Paludisphaera mucosa]MDG3006334.1 heme-binding protein [Paludisphaera mucosa]
MRMRALLPALAAAAVMNAMNARGDDAEGDLKKLEGTWTTTAAGGEAATYVFEGKTLKIKAPSRSYTMEVSLDPAAKPSKTIDLKIVEGPDDAKDKTSKGIYKFENDDTFVFCFRPEGDRPDAFEQVGFEQFLTTLKRKPSDAKPKPKADEPTADAPLPEGWPSGTKVGAIEVKRYPAYRSAVNRTKDVDMDGMGRLFWPLFLHITQKKIAMTAPVVMTFDPKAAPAAEAQGDVSMEFLYRQPTQGEAGQGFGPVAVEDRPAATVVSLGLLGRPGDAGFRESIAKLRAWLDEHKAEWVESGAPRMLGYHGPMTPADRQFFEVQIPIRPVDKAK